MDSKELKKEYTNEKTVISYILVAKFSIKTRIKGYTKIKLLEYFFCDYENAM